LCVCVGGGVGFIVAYMYMWRYDTTTRKTVIQKRREEERQKEGEKKGEGGRERESE
jgi:hypothetical protein